MLISYFYVLFSFLFFVFFCWCCCFFSLFVVVLSLRCSYSLLWFLSSLFFLSSRFFPVQLIYVIKLKEKYGKGVEKLCVYPYFYYLCRWLLLHLFYATLIMIDSASTLGLRTNAYSSMFVPRDGISTIPLLIECYDSCAYPGEYIITRKKRLSLPLLWGMKIMHKN